jgi:hypothetical protein
VVLAKLVFRLPAKGSTNIGSDERKKEQHLPIDQ